MLFRSGIAVLAIDGPGQYEAPLVGLYVSMPNWMQTGKVCYEWLAARPEIDAQKIGITGNSFGSFFATIAAANEPRIKAVTVSATCLEPGGHTIFEEASPTFKMRFMFMSNILEEKAFDEFRKTLTWEGHVEKIAAKAIILNNQHLGMVVQWEDRFYGSVRGNTILGDENNVGSPDNPGALYPDFVKIAAGFGVKGRRVLKKSELREAIQEMLDHDGPYVLDIIVPYTEHVLPMIPAGRTVKDMLLK